MAVRSHQVRLSLRTAIAFLCALAPYNPALTAQAAEVSSEPTTPPGCVSTSGHVLGLAWQPGEGTLLADVLVDGRSELTLIDADSMELETVSSGIDRSPLWLLAGGSDGVTLGADGSVYWVASVEDEGDSLNRLTTDGRRFTIPQGALVEGSWSLQDPRWTVRGIYMLAIPEGAPKDTVRVLASPDNGNVIEVVNVGAATLLAATSDGLWTLVAESTLDGSAFGTLTGADGTARVVDLGQAVNSAALTSDGRTVITGGLGGVLSIPADGSSAPSTQFGDAPVTSVAVNDEGRLAFATVESPTLSGDDMVGSPADSAGDMVCLQPLAPAGS